MGYDMYVFFEMFTGYVWDMFDLYGIFVGCLWDIYETSMVLWDIYILLLGL